MMDDFLRQQEILTPDELVDLHIDIVGAGALGGAIALCLCKMGFGITNSITVTDFDHCSAHNLPTQWFLSSDVLLSRSKVEALAGMVGWVCGRDIIAVEGRFTGTEERHLGPVVVLAVDSLEERCHIWSAIKRRRDVKLLVDARMGAEVVEIFCVCPPDADLYEQSLEDPDGAFSEPCTRRGILYTTLGAASFVGSILRAHARQEPHPRHLVFDFRNFLIQVA